MKAGQGTSARRTTAGAERAPAAPPRFVTLIPPDVNIDFVGLRYRMLAVSWLVIVIGLASVFGLKRFNFGIDFSGGVVMQVRTEGPADFNQIRAALAAAHIQEQGVQRFGEPSDVLIRLGAQSSEAGTQQAVQAVRAALEKAVPGTKVMRTDAVGASVSAELFRNGLLALGISLAPLRFAHGAVQHGWLRKLARGRRMGKHGAQGIVRQCKKGISRPVHGPDWTPSAGRCGFQGLAFTSWCSGDVRFSVAPLQRKSLPHRYFG